MIIKPTSDLEWAKKKTQATDKNVTRHKQVYGERERERETDRQMCFI